METAKRLTVIELHSTIGHVHGVQRQGESLAEVLANGEIEGCVLRQVGPWIRQPGKGIAETGAVVDVGGSKRPPRKSDVAAKVESISLVVIEREEVTRVRKICQATRDGQFAFRDLIGVRKVDLSAVSDTGRAQCQFPAADFGSINRDG